MTAIIILFLAGILLLALEVFVPGAVLGILGALSIIAGVAVAFVTYGVNGGFLALGAGAALLGLALYIEFVILPKSRLARTFSMSTTVAGTSQGPVAELEEVVDQVGETVTVLAPSGYVVVKGRRYEAFSQSGFLAKGIAVRVTGLDNFRLLVTKT
jgi:membrane-bound ClpP family serine protease